MIQGTAHENAAGIRRICKLIDKETATSLSFHASTSLN